MGSVYLPVSSLPPRRPVTPIDYIAGCATIALHVSALCTPPTPSWVFFRRAIAFPLVSACYWWLIWVPIHPTAEDLWGVTCLLREPVYHTTSTSRADPDQQSRSRCASSTTSSSSPSKAYIDCAVILILRPSSPSPSPKHGQYPRRTGRYPSSPPGAASGGTTPPLSPPKPCDILTPGPLLPDHSSCTTPGSYA